MTIRRMSKCVSLHSVILWSAAVLVPRRSRAEWLAEWRSELWYVLQSCDGVPLHMFSARGALVFCLGAYKDAMWLRRNSCPPSPRQHLWLRTPLHCLGFLAAVAAVALSCFFRSTGASDAIMRTAQAHPAVVLGHFHLVAIALLVLPATTSLALGEYPATPRSPARARRFRRWSFLGIKFALILSIMLCGTLNLAPTIIPPQAILAGYILAFRWALIDQRRRCPVCLRLVANPARIGQPSRIFLDWYGTEYFCMKGHGLLYVPENVTTFSRQRWSDLDSSWGSLFSSR